MQFRMSPNVAVRTQHVREARKFYTEVLGFTDRSPDAAEADLAADPINLFVIADDEVHGAVLELFVPDLSEARALLESHGCKVIRWRGKGEDCYVRDPFGVVYNIWEIDEQQSEPDVSSR